MFQDYHQLTEFLESDLHGDLQHYDFEDLVFEWSAEELGIRDRFAARITSIHQLRQLHDQQPWSVFFVEFESKRISIELMRDVLNSLVSIRRKAEAGLASRRRLSASELLFLCRFGEEDDPKLGIVWFDSGGDDARAQSRTITVAYRDPAPRKRRVRELMIKHLQWPEQPGDAVGWWQKWQGIFSEPVETPEVIREMEVTIISSYLRQTTLQMDIPEKHIRLLVRQLHQNQHEIGQCLCAMNEALPLCPKAHEGLRKNPWDYRRFVDRRASGRLEKYHRLLDGIYEEIVLSSNAYQTEFDSGEADQDQLASLAAAHCAACDRMNLKRTLFSDFSDEAGIRVILKGISKAHVHDARAIARLKVLMANNSKLETLIIIGCRSKVEKIASELPKVIGLDQEDIVSEGMIGLLKAIEGYDYEKQTDFHHFSYRRVRNSMEAAIRNFRFFVSVPSTPAEDKFFLDLKDRFVTDGGKISDQLQEFFEQREIPLGRQKEWMARLQFLTGDHVEFHGKLRSMEKAVSEDLEARENPAGGLDLSNLVEQVSYSLETLQEREREVLMRRFGIGEYAGRSQSLYQVASILGIPRETVRQIEARALRQLMHPTRIRMLSRYFESPDH